MVLDWVFQNGLPILVGAIIAVTIEVLFKELIFNEFIAPSFIYQINYQKSKFYKWLHNSSTELSYTSTTHNFDNKKKDKDYVSKILKELQKRKIKAYVRGDIKIEEYVFGNKAFSGVIEFRLIIVETHCRI